MRVVVVAATLKHQECAVDSTHGPAAADPAHLRALPLRCGTAMFEERNRVRRSWRNPLEAHVGRIRVGELDPREPIGIALEQATAVMPGAEAELALDVEARAIGALENQGRRAVDDQVLVLADVEAGAQADMALVHRLVSGIEIVRLRLEGDRK